MTMSITSSSEEERLTQSLTYLIYARCFYGQVDLLSQLIDTEEKADGVDEDIRQLLHQLVETPGEELKLQYDNLFFIPGPYYAPPYASVYLDQDKEDEEQLVHRLSDCYSRFGFLEYANQTGLRHDHIGTMLMFLHFLLQLSLEAEDMQSRQKAEAMYDSMLNEYLMPMYGHFEKKVSEQLMRGFYLDLVQSAHRTIADKPSFDQPSS